VNIIKPYRNFYSDFPIFHKLDKNSCIKVEMTNHSNIHLPPIFKSNNSIRSICYCPGTYIVLNINKYIIIAAYTKPCNEDEQLLILFAMETSCRINGAVRFSQKHILRNQIVLFSWILINSKRNDLESHIGFNLRSVIK